jgi:hypothetical protein
MCYIANNIIKRVSHWRISSHSSVFSRVSVSYPNTKRFTQNLGWVGLVQVRLGEVGVCWDTLKHVARVWDTNIFTMFQFAVDACTTVSIF